MVATKTAVKVDKNLCRLVTPEFVVSYPHIFKPQAPKPTDKAKFSITMLFDKDRELIGSSPTGEPRTLKEIIRNAKILKFGSKENWPEGLVSPVGDGDDPKYKDKEGYKGRWVIKATSTEDSRPGVVDRNMVPITDPAEFYPGCIARSYIYAYVWEYMKKQGVGFILDHVQKLRDGKSFGGKKPVDQVFGAVEDDESSPDNDDDDMDFK